MALLPDVFPAISHHLSEASKLLQLELTPAQEEKWLLPGAG
jgi:hypothetical protein